MTNRSTALRLIAVALAGYGLYIAAMSQRCCSAGADISELFGTYASADVHAGAGESSAAQVVTKGTVSLAFSGTGKGIDLGVTFGEFVISKQSAKPKRK